MDSQCALSLFSSPTPGFVAFYSAEAYCRYLYGSNSNSIEVARIVPFPLTHLLLSVDSIQSAIEDGLYPALTTDSTGGVYFCYNRYEGVEAVFKPLAEEPYCDANPKKLTSAKLTLAMDRGVTPGCGGLREVAAYYLDRDHFAGVPETVLAAFPNVSFSCPSPRVIGSLQLFVPHECSSEDYGPVMFSVDVHSLLSPHR